MKTEEIKHVRNEKRSVKNTKETTKKDTIDIIIRKRIKKKTAQKS